MNRPTDPQNEERRRADQSLVERGLMQSRAQAQAAIEAGGVRADGEPVRRAAQLIRRDAVLEAMAPHPWASRGGIKLAAALAAFRIDPNGLFCLDVGASTGGFTDVLLANGAARITAVDVGRGQMIERLAKDPRVTLLEGTDARALTIATIGGRPDLIVVDVSFISLAKVLPLVLPLGAPRGRLVALIKPQFEAGRENVGKGGIVRDPLAQEAARDRIVAEIAALGWKAAGYIDSPIEGGDGNREFLVAAFRDRGGDD